VDLVIGRRGGDGTWEELETVTASNPAAAFSQWVDGRGGVDAGEYGARETDATDWEWLFRVDDDGLHPVETF
jgi:hypothetical protein